MHLLAVSLLAILAGTLLLAKTKKDGLGKFFAVISWFFVVVGFILFIGFIARSVCDKSHCCKAGSSECRQEVMMKGCQDGMHDKTCCPPDRCKGDCEKRSDCMHHGQMKKRLPADPSADTSAPGIEKPE